MKSSIHLLYGIIIGILLVACTGSIKEGKAEFKEEKIVFQHNLQENNGLTKLKQEGWTILDVEFWHFGDVESSIYIVHVGK